MVGDAGLRAISASGTVGLCSWILGPDAAPITEADDAFLALVGYDRESLVALGPLDWRRLTPPDSASRLDERFAELSELGSHGPREQEIISRTGRHVPLLVVSAMVDVRTGAAASMCIDITEQVRARADAERASQAKSRFLAVMTHELRTPLNTIMGQTELVAEGTYGTVTDKQRDALARLKRAASQLRSLVDEVLTFSRLETGVVQYDVTDVPLADALAAVGPLARSQAAAKDIVFDLELPNGEMCVRADFDKLRDVLIALLSNAVKFTPAGGRITLNTATRDTASEYVFVRVSDTGSGIARARQNAVFEPFTQMDEGRARSATGLGLGLTISRDLARGMGGDLRVRSAEGDGSTFTLSLRRSGAGR
ncbi:MAG: ATP-binding region ATPase domain protein [Gemmatimonadetes bacterium]|nr:ATP-binding region ATPase domain protein [Gemmatimonadota bacterium]